MYKFMGEYSGDETYEKDDIVTIDDVVYKCTEGCTGVPVSHSRFWRRLSDPLNTAVQIAGQVAANIPLNVGDQAIVLKSSTLGSNKSFIITVDDDGEIAATELR